ncbi:MAG: snoRNA-binding rRNA-processing protein [Thelocarpon impressellum]|nr:MAG: snoRNA-binding rRNA-processing protein [Thelocarpon impressellum]
MPRTTAPTASGPRQARRHNPLSDDLVANSLPRTKPGKRKTQQHDDQEGYVDSKSSRRILRIGQDLAEEDERARRTLPTHDAFAFESRFGEDEEAEAYDDDDDETWGEEDEVVEEQDMDPHDVDLFNRFMTARDDRDEPAERGVNLADILLERIAAHEAAEAMRAGHPAVLGGGDPEDAVELPAQVVEVYTRIGGLLSRYRSGKLPKPFKVIPSLPNWEDLLFVTRPEAWTPNACYEATKIFVSCKPAVTQFFLENVLLGRVRFDIHETKKLNVHLYKALKKTLYKPAAFFKGFLFPLVESETCTLREAHIVSSVLARVSIPVLHSAAALLRLCDVAAEQAAAVTEEGGATNIFIRVLLEKKYALPYRVIDVLVFHFLRFRPAANREATSKDARLPVLWHQSLLAFAQRYRNDITEDQREMLLDLLATRGHSAIGPEVRRELLEGRSRDAPVEEPAADGGDDTMMMVDAA